MLDLKYIKHIIFLLLIGSVPPSTSSYDITMLTQFTLDRFPALEILVSRWLGPLHALLYADDKEAQKLVRLVKASKAMQDRKNIAFHVVYKRKVSVAHWKVLLFCHSQVIYSNLVSKHELPH